MPAGDDDDDDFEDDDEGDDGDEDGGDDDGDEDESRPRSRPGASVEDHDWSQRTLCPDGACVGVIAANGVCTVCGKSAA